MCWSASAANNKRYVNIVFIGNSITFGAGLPKPVHDAPPVKAALFLSKCPEVASVKYSNRGQSGCTTVEYLPDTNTLIPWEGTNGCPVAPEWYYENMKTIINRLLALYPNCRIVVHRPLWYSPNTYNGAKYLEEGLRRLQDYYPQIQRLVDYYASHFPGQVFLGDTKGFDYFKENHLTDFKAEKGNSGVFYLHPNEKGAARLGELWSEAIRQALGL